jgi:hypothetical protein
MAPIRSPCRIPNCGHLSHGYSPLCTGHKKANIRNGHPLQVPIERRQLRPYVEKVEARRARNPDSEAWAILQRRWQGLVDQARRILRDYYEVGRALPRRDIQAAQQVDRIAKEVDSDKVVNTALALGLMWRQEPRAFRSDKAFDFQLVRAIRRLAPTNVGTWWNPKTKKSQGYYKDLSLRTNEDLAAWLKAVFLDAMARIAALEEREGDQEAIQKQRLADAFEAMQ